VNDGPQLCLLSSKDGLKKGNAGLDNTSRKFFHPNPKKVVIKTHHNLSFSFSFFFKIA